MIGILAAITIVSYTGISQRAMATALQSDLTNASKQLKLYDVLYGSYPTSLDSNNCPNAPSTDMNYCLKASSGDVYSYYQSSNVSTARSFSLQVKSSSGTSYRITNDSAPKVGSDSRASCLAILNAGESTGDGIYWIKPSGTTFPVYCNMTDQGGGWTLAINLQTSDGNIRHYDDTDFWTGTAQYGNINAPFANDFKSTAFSQVPATELMMMANNLGVLMGTAKYSLIAPATGNNLYWMFNNLTNTTITGNRTGNSGSVGSNGRSRNDGDSFIDHTYPVIINSTYQPLDAVNVTRLGTNYAASCGVINCNGHTFGGWGGRTTRASWGAYYEGAAINGYCPTQGGFGSNGSLYTSNNAFDGGIASGCGTTLLATVDMAVFVR